MRDSTPDQPGPFRVTFPVQCEIVVTVKVPDAVLASLTDPERGLDTYAVEEWVGEAAHEAAAGLLDQYVTFDANSAHARLDGSVDGVGAETIEEVQ